MEKTLTGYDCEIVQGTGALVRTHSSRIDLGKLERSVPSCDFPTTRYYGSKLRLVEWIRATCLGLEFETALDLFGGTATVSLLLKSLDKHVTYNDIFEFNSHVARAVLSSDSDKFRYKELLEFSRTIEKKEGVISSNFENVFYTDDENAWLDGAVRAIRRKRDLQYQSDLFYCLFQACLQKRPFNLFHRKNLHLRKNNKKDTKFGNWRTWERSFDELISRAASELGKAKSIRVGQSVVLAPGDASDLSPGYDLVYIDPPYVNSYKNDTTYLDRYHFLEGMCRYDDWESMMDSTKKTKRLRLMPGITEWNSKSIFKEKLFSLIDVHRHSMVVLSYGSSGVPDIFEIQDFLKSRYKNVVMLRRSFPHALRKKKNQEVVFVGAN